MIETKRLILDLHQAADLDAMSEIWSDPETVRYIGGRPFTRHECWQRLLRYSGLWPVLGYGFWAIREKASGRFAGDLGFADFRRDADPPLPDCPEAGWVLASWARGKGFADEALGAALTWFDREKSFNRSFCVIEPANAPSIALAERHGYRREGTATLGEHQTIVFERRR